MEAGHSSELLALRYGATLHPFLDDSNLLYSFVLFFFLLSVRKTSPSTLIFNVGSVLLAYCSTMSSFSSLCCNSAVYTKANIPLCCYVYEFIFLM